MVTATGSALSAVHAYGRKLTATADNIANVNTDSFKRNRTSLSEAENGGVRAVIQKDRSPGPPNPLAANRPEIPNEQSNVNIAEELVGLTSTTVAYKANLQTIRTEDDMMGSLLNIVA